MEGIEYLYELCEALPRCGPGGNECTRRAFDFIKKLPDHPYILDIGCGPGVQTVELAKISGGKIIALDNHQAFLEKLMKNAQDEGLLDNIIPKNTSMNDMDFEEETFDVIWSEGALYIMGFQNGLRRCRQLLKRAGYLAVTEAVYLLPTPPAQVTRYFQIEYPDMKDVNGNIEVISKEGFHLLSHFTLPEYAWLDNYYLPLERELSCLELKYQGNKIASVVFEGFRKEIELYKKYSQFYGYEFFVMQKSPCDHEPCTENALK